MLYSIANRIRWDQRHEDNLFDNLSVRSAFQRARKAIAA